MGRKLFYLSLIILSIAMGLDWQKNRPKTSPLEKKKPPVARPVNVDDEGSEEGSDGELLANASGTATASGTANASDSEDVEGEGSDEGSGSGKGSGSGSGAGSGSAHPPAEIAASPTLALDADPILAAWKTLKRSPFAPSPFKKMAEEAKNKAASEGVTLPGISIKPTSVLAAQFSGIVETDKELIAVIDKRLYRKSEDYANKKIKRIERDLITLEDEKSIYLLPKTGVQLEVNASGTISKRLDNYFDKALKTGP